MKTHETKLENLEDAFTANGIANSLGMKRNTVSLYLNDLYSDGKLIKINSRPVYFLHRQEIEDKNHAVRKNSYTTLQEFYDEIKSSDALEQFVMINPSLKESIERIKAALLYPNGGLPLLITGQSGTGKSFLFNLIYQFCVAKGLVKSNAPFISINCAQYADNPELLTSNLFGYSKGAFTGANDNHRGAFEEADNGIIFLDEVHRLGPKGQEKLFTYLDKGIIYRVGNTNKPVKVDVRVFFATTESLVDNFLTTFMRRIPVKVNMPSLEEKDKDERLNLIVTLLKGEQTKMQKPIKVDKNFLNSLVNYQPAGNIGALKNSIKVAVAKANAEQQNEKVIELSVYYLSEDVLSKTKKLILDGDREELLIKDSTTINDLVQKDDPHKNIFFSSLKNILQLYQTSDYDLDESETKLKQEVYQIFDYLIFENNNKEKKSVVSYLIENVKRIFDQLKNAYQLRVSGNAVYAVTYYLYERQKLNLTFLKFVDDPTMLKLHEAVKERYSEVYRYVHKLINLVKDNLDIELKNFDYVLLTVYLNKLEILTKTGLIKAVIIAHGYSTASSIANVANRFLDSHVFESFDMPFNVSTTEIANHILDYSESNDISKGLIILVDMGSLKEIEELFPRQLNTPILLMNNVSTTMALGVGESILKGLNFKKIIEKTKELNNLDVKLTYPRIKKKSVILTTCHTGIGTAAHVAKLLERCLPSAKRVEIIPYDFNTLKREKNSESVFKIYDVLGVIGTDDPGIEGIDFVYLEKILSSRGTEILKSWLEGVLTTDENNAFSDQLVKNFSLERIINSITILDAQKVIEMITIFMQESERNLNVNIPNDKKFTLYVHISYLIERLIRKETVDLTQEFKDSYLKIHRKELNIIKKSFSVITDAYSVKIPLPELIYIDQIIFNRS